MAAPTVAEVKARVPALATVADPTIQLAIDDAACLFNEVRWGCYYAQGVACYVGHIVLTEQKAASGTAAAAGPVTGKRVGDVQVNYATAVFTKATDAFFATTPYGQRYMMLRRLVGIGALAV